MPQDFKEVEDYFSQHVTGSVFADIQPRNLFAGPEPDLLDEVVVTGRDLIGKISTEPVVPKSLSPWALDSLLGVAGRVLNPLLLLATPGVTGPRGTGELQPDMIIDNTRPELPLLDEVVVNPPRPPSSPPADFAFPQDPPNWNDLVEWPGPEGGPMALFPMPADGYRDYLNFRSDPSDRPAVGPQQPDGSIELDPLPAGPSVFPKPGTPALPSPSLPAPGLFPDPFALPQPGPDRTARPEPSPYASPSPTPGPDAFPTGDPFLDPIGDPTWGNPVRNLPFGPSGPDAHDPFFGPGGNLDPTTGPLPDPFEQPFAPKPPQDADTCNCDKKPKKKKKKSEPRTVCYKGTYRQLKKGIIYTRGAEVPCEAKGASSTSSPRKKAPKLPKDLGGLADIVFGRS